MARGGVAVVGALLCACASTVCANGLVDNPIRGASETYIDTVNGGGSWTASSPTVGFGPIAASVPGDLITDLQKAGKVGDPLYELNWLRDSAIWDDHTWTYSTTFTLDEAAQAAASQDGGEVLLVFDGIKMGATISVNGQQVGTAEDQFLRYSFPLKASGATLRADGANKLEVEFDPSLTVDGRYMACTGGWDWAPYTNTYQDANPGKAHTFTKGIWKSVYVVAVPEGTVAVTHVVPHTFYNGDFPTEPLKEHDHAGFTVAVRTHVWAAAPVDATLGAAGKWSEDAVSQPWSIPAGESNQTIQLKANAEDIELWWPAGVGSQPLYNMTASVTVGSNLVEVERFIGFRYFALVTGNDTDPTWVAANKDADGTVDNGMRFRVNGAPVYSRGANMIPMDELEGRLDAQAHRNLVESAVAAGMNTLRVWGGGIFLPDAWYDTCDELGIMVYHDMQFAQQGHSPCDPACPTQEAEFRHQVRRLSHHPSICLWDGCNECKVLLGTPTGIYASFVLTVVAEEDKSRAIWPSCPAIGWSNGVNRLSSIPNGSPKGLVPQTSVKNTIETHGPYQHGSGFPAMNGPIKLTPFPSNLPITLTPNTPTGLGVQNVFASEFGGSVWSSYESVAPTLDPKHYSLHGGTAPDSCTDANSGRVCTGNNTAAQRNYPCDNYLSVYFGLSSSDLDAVGEDAFKKQLFLCMLGQTLWLKTTIEMRRSLNQFGTIVWQYGEIWPTGGWGSIEYGSAAEGQVLGGRWKPMQYLYARHLYTDQTAACDGSGNCYVKNDAAAKPFTGSVVVNAVDLATGASTTLKTYPVAMAPGPGVTSWFTVDLSGTPADSSVLVVEVLDSSGGTVANNVQLRTVPSALKLPKASVSFTVGERSPDGSIDVAIDTSGGAALYVTLTSTSQGRFSDNAVLTYPGVKRTVKFLPNYGASVTPSELTASTRIEHLGSYM